MWICCLPRSRPQPRLLPASPHSSAALEYTELGLEKAAPRHPSPPVLRQSPCLPPTTIVCQPPITQAPSSPSTTPVTPFSQFSRLPVELRLLIWRQCLPRPRMLAIRDNSIFGDFPLFQATLHKLRNNIEIPLLEKDPVLLNVNQEARAVVCRHYSYCPYFLFRLDTSFIDFSLDTVGLSRISLDLILVWGLGHYGEPRLDGDCMFENKRDLRRVRHLVLSFDEDYLDILVGTMHRFTLTQDPVGEYFRWVISVLPMLESLTQLTLVVSNDFIKRAVVNLHAAMKAHASRVGEPGDRRDSSSKYLEVNVVKSSGIHSSRVVDSEYAFLPRPSAFENTVDVLDVASIERPLSHRIDENHLSRTGGSEKEPRGTHSYVLQI